MWNETFGYDGFGNLTGKTLNGTLQSIPVNSATNQLSGPTYDLNGNMTVGAGATMTYNEDNRMSSAQESSGGAEYDYYTPDGKRFYRSGNSNPQFTLYGVHGEALATYSYSYTDATGEMSVYFGGRRLWQAPYYSSSTGSNGVVFADRLGSNRYVQSSPGSGSYYIANYYPYGDAAGTAPQDQVGFATYTQDSYTGLDYAGQRMYASTYGRFSTVDSGKAHPKDPVSWNRYSYVGGDPVNRFDPRGLDWMYLGDGQWCSTLDPAGGCYDPEGDDDDSLLAGSSNPCDTQSALFNPSAAVMGCMQYYAAIETSAQTVPSCTIEVYNRQIDATHGLNLIFAQHGYIEFLDPNGDASFAEGNKKGNLLTAYAGPAGGQSQSDVTSPHNLDGSLSGPAVCGWLSILEGDASNVNLAKIPYHWYGPNSNSVLAYMLNSLPNTSWFNLPFLTGYTTPLPLKP